MKRSNSSPRRNPIFAVAKVVIGMFLCLGLVLTLMIWFSEEVDWQLLSFTATLFVFFYWLAIRKPRPGKNEDTPTGPIEKPDFREDIELAQRAEQLYLQTGNPQSLNEAISLWQSIASHPLFEQADESFRSAVLNYAGGTLLRRYWSAGAIPDLDRALNLWQQALALTPADSPARPAFLNNLGNGLRDRYARTGKLEALEEAIQVTQQALASTPADSPDRPALLNNLGTGLATRYARTGQLEDLEEAIQVTQQSLASTPPDAPGRSARLNNLGNSLRERYARTKQTEDLEEAIRLTRQALTLTESPGRPALLHSLGNSLRERYAWAGQVEDLEEAISVFQQADDMMPADAPGRAELLANWGTVLQDFHVRMGQLQDLEDAISIFREALDLTPADSPNRPAHLAHLSSGLSARYKRTGQPEDLDEAIRISRQVLASTAAESPDRPARLYNLGTDLRARFERAGQMEDVEEAIRLSEQAIAISPEDSPDYPAFLNNLGNSLRGRYLRTGRLEDLEEAIRRCRQAVANTPSTDAAGYAARLNDLGIALRIRYARTRQPEYLEEAIELLQQAVALTPKESPSLPTHLSNLGNSLFDLYKRTRQLEDLEEMMGVHRQALAVSPVDTPEHPAILSNLGVGLQDRYERTRQLEDLEEAIGVLRQALALVNADSPGRPGLFLNLGNGLRDRYARTGRLEDLEEARRFYREACDLAEHRSHQTLLTASRAWGDWALDRQDWQEATEAYAYGLKAIRNLYKVQFSRTGKESFMHETRGLTAKAAYASWRNGKSQLALEILESGRARLMGEALERTRRDLELLGDPAVGHRDLLERYRVASARYNEMNELAEVSSTAGISSARASLLPADWIRQFEHAQAELDRVIDEIRQVPGYETFLVSPTVAQIQLQAADAILVYLAVLPAGGLALVVTDTDIQAIELPALTEKALHRQVIDGQDPAPYLRAYLDWRADPYDEARRETWKQALDRSARWLWDAVMQPVIEAFKTLFPEGSRIILIPSDWLSLLPLHAAWTPDESRPCGRLYAMDEFTFTYAPGALALIRARLQATETPARKLLVVENPDRSLAFSGYPAQAALASFDDKTHLLEESATFDAVRAAFTDHNVLFFFTHGIARFDEPLKSGLTLADHPLTLADIFNLNTSHARLAVLSACETGVSSNLNLLDEVISLPSGLMQAGVPGVIGSLWTVLEASTAILMTIFFEQWLKAGLSAPEALRKAQMIVRDAAQNKEAQNYFKESETEGTALPAMDMLHKELLINDFDHPFYWAAFTYTGL